VWTSSTCRGLSFSYDGFGNKLGQTVTKGTAPAGAWAVDPATNRLMGQSYDANGNPLPVGSSYGVENRLLSVVGADGRAEHYAYGADHRRLYKYRYDAVVQEEVYFYGAGASCVFRPSRSLIPI